MIEKDIESKNDMICMKCKIRNSMLTKTSQGWICDRCLTETGGK